MLHRLNLDYCRAPLPPARAGWALLAGGVLAFAASSGWAWRLQVQLAVAESQLRALDRASAAAAGERVRRVQPSRAEVIDVGRANALLRSLNVRWEDLFRAVEASAHEDIALLQLQPDAQKGTARITGEAKDFAALAAYAGELSRREPILGVALQSHEQDAHGKPLRFTLVARWSANGS